MSAYHWRLTSKRIIQQVVNKFLQENELKLTDLTHLSPNALNHLRKLISKAYPFGARKYYPYTIWRAEVKAYFDGLRGINRPPRYLPKPKSKKAEIPGQLSLF